MTGEFEPDKFEDRYENAMIELIRSKQAGLPAPKEKAAVASRQRRQPDGCAAPQRRGRNRQGQSRKGFTGKEGACRSPCPRQTQGQGLKPVAGPSMVSDFAAILR